MRQTEPAEIINGYEIYPGRHIGSEIFEILDHNNSLQNVIIEPLNFPSDIEQEEGALAAQDLSTASPEQFERVRLNTIEGFRAIIEFLLGEHNLPTSNGVDFRSRAAGMMVENLLKPHIDKETWTQVESNPFCVAENRRRHPDSRILQGTYHDVKALELDGNVDIVTGLSALDSTHFLDHAVSQISSALKPGGHLLHIQDVRPGAGAAVREMLEVNIAPPYSTKAIKSGRGIEPLFYQTPEGWLSTGELCRRQIGRAIENCPELELVSNKWITAEKGNEDVYGAYYLNLHVTGWSAIGTLESFRDKISVIVTVAKKR
ncbi:hypothetical protein KJ742_06275 [Patescibacteria group bacterium]|nr:hypothetical protein [Patescibacteria group bacterium]MBU1683517.1 hypothetical protein [Patescibacteria group bacterium]MBU1935391.1 hypothetical protein [Patescibacteria group bacterium]